MGFGVRARLRTATSVLNAARSSSLAANQAQLSRRNTDVTSRPMSMNGLPANATAISPQLITIPTHAWRT